MRRHPAPGGYATGRRTRARIILAALRIFGEYGYERASTRRIAERASVNTPAIQYYFGGKQGLHAACTRHVIGRMSSLLALPLTRARDALHKAEPAAALDALCELLMAVIDGLVVAGSENWSRYLECLTRDCHNPERAMFHEHIGAEMFATMARLIAAATGNSAGGELTRLRAYVLLGQVSSLYEHRALAFVEMGCSHFDEQGVALVKSVIREHTRGALATSRTSMTQSGRQPRGPSWVQPGG